MSEIWQTMAMMMSSSGLEKVGLCTQNVLWSDARVFAEHSAAAGNAIMYAISERALQLCKGRTFTSPVDLLDEFFVSNLPCTVDNGNRVAIGGEVLGEKIVNRE